MDTRNQEGGVSTVHASMFFGRTFDEAVELLHEARRFVAQERAAPSEMDVETRLIYSRETMRLTTRLTSIMAWLLVQKAVHAGELTPREAASEAHRLYSREMCLKQPDEGLDQVPAKLCDLLRRSRTLYERISRLDQRVARSRVAG